MASLRQARLVGLDISDRVESWGNLELIKTVLLAEATMVTSEHTLTVSNHDGAFLPNRPNSLVAGLNWYGALVDILLDGQLVYEGRVRDIRISPDGLRAMIVSEDVMKQPAQTAFVGSGTAQNAGDVLLAMARTALPDSLIDIPSFLSSGGPSRAAGATVTYSFTASSGMTCMGAMDELSSLASISVYVNRNLLVARAFQPYQGNGAGLRWQITDDVLRQVPTVQRDVLSFFNRVVVGYPTGQTVALDDKVSQRVNHVVRTKTFPESGNAHAADLASAQYFGSTYLDRASFQRRIVDLTIGREVNDVDLGQRYPVRSAWFGLLMAGEVIEAHRVLDRDETTLKLAELRDPFPSGETVSRS